MSLGAFAIGSAPLGSGGIAPAGLSSAYTIYSNHPRLFFRDTDKTALTARTNDTAGWKTFWDSTAIPRADVLKTKTASQLVQVESPHTQLMVLAFVGYIEESGRPAAGYKDSAILAAVYLSSLADTVEPLNRRHRLLALALVFDICYTDMTTAERNTVAGEITQQIDRQTHRDDEQMDGHSEDDQLAALAGELAIAGYSTFATGAQDRLDVTYAYMFGSVPNQGRMQMPRYEHSDGGGEKGGWYQFLGLWGELWSMWLLDNATNLDPFTDESAWASRTWEWMLWNFRGGSDNDFEAQGDTAKIASPKFHVYQHWAYSILASKYPTANGKQGGQILRWLYDTWSAFDSAFADNSIFDVIFLDRAAVAPIHPKDASPAPATSRLFSPPGVAYYRQAGRASGDADWDPDKSVVFRMSARKWYYFGHPHLDSGACQIHFKGDPILLAPAGYYDSYGSTHHQNAYQRSWLQSLSPIIKDPAQVYQRYSVTIDNDGGQHYRRFAGAAAPSVEADPNYVYAMQNDAGGEAWLRSRRFVELANNSNQWGLLADIKDSYRKFYTDNYRAAPLETKLLIIKPSAGNGLTWPALLVYVRIKKTAESQVTQIPFHSYNAMTSTAYGWTTTGKYGVGKLWGDVRNIGAYTLRNVAPGTPLDANGYGPDQFRPSGVGTNWPPLEAANTRYLPDLKRHSMFVEKTTQIQEEHYVFLLMPTGVADSEPVPSRAWVTDAAQPDWYGITLGSETHFVSRTQDLVAFGTPQIDTTPPAEATGVSLASKNHGILARWTDPADADFEKALVYYRTSAI